MAIFKNISSLLSEQEKKRVKLTLEIVVVVLAGGILIAALTQKKNTTTTTKSSPKPTPTAKVIKTAGKIPLYAWTGEIKEKNGNTLIVEGFDGKKTMPKKVIIDKNTQITQLRFIPTLSNGEERYVPRDTKVSPENLKTGYQVEAFAGIDISELNQFSAKKIRILP